MVVGPMLNMLIPYLNSAGANPGWMRKTATAKQGVIKQIERVPMRDGIENPIFGSTEANCKPDTKNIYETHRDETVFHTQIDDCGQTPPNDA